MLRNVILVTLAVMLSNVVCPNAQLIPEATKELHRLSTSTFSNRQLLNLLSNITSDGSLSVGLLLRKLMSQWSTEMVNGGLLSSNGSNRSDSRCVSDLVSLLSLKELWAYSMLDAAGKPQSGILRGDYWWMGEYTQCLDISVSRNNSDQLNGVYCSLTIGNASQTGESVTSANVIKWDLCLPNSCSPENITSYLNSVIRRLSTTIRVLQTVCTDGSQPPLGADSIAVISLLSILAAVVVVATICDLLQQHRESLHVDSIGQQLSVSESSRLLPSDANSFQHSTDTVVATPLRFCYQILLSFSICANAKKILHVDSSSVGTDNSVLQPVHGIRFLSMSWVILGHTWVFIIGQSRNILDLLSKCKTFAFQAVLNATVSVDSFFLLSGTLVSYLLLRELQRVEGPKHIKWLRLLVHRYLRLTPVYLILLGVFATIYNYWIVGPSTFATVGTNNDCHTNFWTNMLYINNLVFPNQQCFGWAWYLANDMQLFLFSLGFIVLIHKSFVGGIVALSLLTSFSCIVTAVITAVNGYPASSPAVIHTPNYNQPGYFKDIYTAPWCRAGPYLIGVMLGAILFRCKCKARMHWILAVFLWCVAFVCNMTVLYGFYYDVNGDYMSPAANAIYAGVHRTLWAIGVAWVIFACVTGYGGAVNWFLSWSGFVPLSRLTYVAYLVHPMVIFWFNGNLQQTVEMTDFVMVYQFCGHLVLSYALAFIVSTTCEAPVLNILKIVKDVGK